MSKNIQDYLARILVAYLKARDEVLNELREKVAKLEEEKRDNTCCECHNYITDWDGSRECSNCGNNVCRVCWYNDDNNEREYCAICHDKFCLNCDKEGNKAWCENCEKDFCDLCASSKCCRYKACINCIDNICYDCFQFDEDTTKCTSCNLIFCIDCYDNDDDIICDLCQLINEL